MAHADLPFTVSYFPYQQSITIKSDGIDIKCFGVDIQTIWAHDIEDVEYIVGVPLLWRPKIKLMVRQLDGSVRNEELIIYGWLPRYFAIQFAAAKAVEIIRALLKHNKQFDNQ